MSLADGLSYRSSATITGPTRRQPILTSAAPTANYTALGLVAGDPDGEVTLAWTVAQDVMAVYQLDAPDRARTQVTELIMALRECPIPELARLGRTLHARRVENLNLKIKNTKRIARGYRNFDHYRLRLLLNHGRIRDDHSPTRIRTRAPRFAA